MFESRFLEDKQTKVSNESLKGKHLCEGVSKRTRWRKWWRWSGSDRQVSGWIPDFVKDEEEESDTEDEIRDEELHDENAEDPFNIYDLLNKKQDNSIEGYSSDNMKYPPRFTPTVATEFQSNAFKESEIEGGECLQNIHNEKVASENGEVVIMGDFNEVHKQPERYGSIFNAQGAEAFNSFISAAGLEEVEFDNNVTCEEIKRAVWDCGADKSPGPNGFTFRFYRRYWSFLEKDAEEAIYYFFQYGTFPKGGNSSFIFLIPKTYDAKMVKDFRPVTLIGSLYKIIAKILANRLVVVLGDIVNEVQSAFVATRQILDGSFILNELFHWCKKKKKRTMIFKVDFEKAYDSVRWDSLDDVLKFFGFGDSFIEASNKGDPLSLFLFILIMESLHILVQRVVDAYMFRGISMGPSLHLSYLFCADDAVFMGHWSDSNIDTIIQGGRLTLLKSVLGSIPIYHMSLFKVPMKVLQIMESIRYHFFNGVDHNGKKPIWVKWSKVLASKEKGEQLKNQGTNLIGFIHKKIGNGADTSFWEDVWRGEGALKTLYPRIYALETCKNVIVGVKMSYKNVGYPLCQIPRGGIEQVQFLQFLACMEGVDLVDMRDRWVWFLEGSREFFIASVRRLIDECWLPKGLMEGRGNSSLNEGDTRIVDLEKLCSIMQISRGVVSEVQQTTTSRVSLNPNVPVANVGYDKVASFAGNPVKALYGFEGNQGVSNLANPRIFQSTNNISSNNIMDRLT
uniref:RNA-directed DNA polymerase, eukaryota, reverse transcriptase zinc-binding domain protein n=1 Tax=Tanacetum cinerariifolium TaxID=118510 RepID=A0A699HH35_TANCI|nr:RNA-directed DNA polymerase, eukaryota, reverse transcriptase zinc-binding domain protein [Tanacetum cinerariifolium]